MANTKINVICLEHHSGLPLPSHATEHSAGMDLYAANVENVTIAKGAVAIIPTGICIGLPAGLEAQIRPRSGIAAKYAVTVLNTPGTIDADYRGEIKVILINLGQIDFVVERGMRIAQMVIASYIPTTLIQVESLDSTVRGEGGFGSTGGH